MFVYCTPDDFNFRENRIRRRKITGKQPKLIPAFQIAFYGAESNAPAGSLIHCGFLFLL